MGFHLDARNTKTIDKVVSGFGLLRYWHDTNYRARIVVKVLLNDDAKIPHDVVVTMGSNSRIWSWTYPIYALKRSNRTMLGDEDQVPPEGPLHPLPVGPSCWIGPNPANPSSVDLPQINVSQSVHDGADGGNSNVGGGMDHLFDDVDSAANDHDMDVFC